MMHFPQASLLDWEKRFVTSHRSFLPLWEVFKRTYIFVNNFLVTVMISNGDLRSQPFTESLYTITSYYPILFVRLHCVLPAFENIRSFNFRYYLMFSVLLFRIFPLVSTYFVTCNNRIVPALIWTLSYALGKSTGAASSFRKNDLPDFKSSSKQFFPFVSCVVISTLFLFEKSILLQITFTLLAVIL